jgi:hypothetical protein
LQLNGKLEGTVGEWAFSNQMPFSPCLQFCSFDSVSLQEAIEFLRFTPAPTKIVIVELADRRIADQGILPGRELNGPAHYFAAKETGLFMPGRWEVQSPTSRLNGHGITDLSLDGNNVGQPDSSSEKGVFS